MISPRRLDRTLLLALARSTTSSAQSSSPQNRPKTSERISAGRRVLRVIGKIGRVRGFEPPTPCSQSRCATGLRHTPKIPVRVYARPREPFKAPGRAIEGGFDGLAPSHGLGGSPGPSPRAPTRRTWLRAADGRNGFYPKPPVPRGASRMTPSTTPSAVASRPSGAQSATTERKRAPRRSGGTPSSSRSSFRYLPSSVRPSPP